MLTDQQIEEAAKNYCEHEVFGDHEPGSTIYENCTDDFQAGAKWAVSHFKKEYELTVQNLRRESQLACDLRNSQDLIIERCAMAIADKFPKASEILRNHVDGISGEDWGDIKRDLEWALSLENIVPENVAEQRFRRKEIRARWGME